MNLGLEGQETHGRITEIYGRKRQNDMAEKTLNIDEVAKHLQARPSTISKCLRQGRLTGFKLTGSWLVLESELQRFIQTEAACAVA